MNLEDQLYRNKISYLNIVLAVLIVIRHTVNIEIYGLTSGFLYQIEKFISEATDLIVPMFYALSGFLFFQNLEWGNIKMKLFSRFKSLCIPYVSWCLISYLFYLILNLNPVICAHMNQVVEPINIVNLIHSILYRTYNSPLWFLQYLIGYIALTPIIFLFLENKVSREFSRSYKAFVLLFIFVIAVLCPNRFFYYSIPFVFGASAGRYNKSIVKSCYNIYEKFIASIVLLLSIVIGMIVDFGRFYMIIRIVQIIAIWLVADAFRIEKEPKAWMQISFTVFCSHTLILEPLEKLFLIAFGRNGLGALLDFMFAPIITIGVILVCSLFCKKIPVLWRVLNGGR